MKPLTTKRETKNISWLGFGVITFSVIMMGVTGAIAPHTRWTFADFLTLQVLYLSMLTMGVLIVLLAFIERKYVKIIKEIWSEHEETREAIREGVFYTNDNLKKEIRECRNLEDNTPRV